MTQRQPPDQRAATATTDTEPTQVEPTDPTTSSGPPGSDTGSSVEQGTTPLTLAGVPIDADAAQAPRPTSDLTVDVQGRALSLATVVARAQDGDIDAFDQLVRSYQAELVRLGYRMLSDHGEAQDAAQDTFVLAWRNLPRLADPMTFHAWIYQIMSRRCLNVIRGRTRRRTDLVRAPQPGELSSADGLDRPDTGGDPAERVQAMAARAGLNQVLDTLPADQRACWVLKEMHDLTYPEIAYATGVPVSTVRGRIARARHHLMAGMTAWQTTPRPAALPQQATTPGQEQR